MPNHTIQTEESAGGSRSKKYNLTNFIQVTRRGHTFLVLDLGLDIVDGVAALDLKGDGLPGQGLDEDLHLDKPGPADEAQCAVAAASYEWIGRGEKRRCDGRAYI
jgi:hypothetical protein